MVSVRAAESNRVSRTYHGELTPNAASNSCSVCIAIAPFLMATVRDETIIYPLGFRKRHLRKPEHSLQHEKGVLHFRADTRLRPVLRPLSLINHALVSITTVREVLSVRRRLPDRFALASVRLVTPYPCLVPVQQVRQHFGVGHIRRRRRHRVDQLALTVGADVRLHAEIPLVTLLRLMHVRVA